MFGQHHIAQATPYVAPGDQVYTTAGTYTFTVPANVYSVCAVAIGAGGGEFPGNSNNVWGGGGGALAYVNNLAVTPGQTISVTVGSRGTYNGTNASGGATSQFGSLSAGGGGGASNGSNGSGGNPSGSYTAGFSGGAGVFGSSVTVGAGSAAGYTSNGANGGNSGSGVFGSGGTNGGYGRGDNTNWYNPSPSNSTDGAVRVMWGAGRNFPSNAT